MHARFLRFTCIFIFTCAIASRTAQSQWSENFDDYPTGSTIVGQGGWEAWDLAALDADVVDDVASSEPNSLRLRPDSDMVVVFSGFKGGVWKVRTMVYIPSDHRGETWFILLNLYAHGGNKNWSTQVCFRNGRVESLGGSDFAGSGSLPWIADAWVPLELIRDRSRGERADDPLRRGIPR